MTRYSNPEILLKGQFPPKQISNIINEAIVEEENENASKKENNENELPKIANIEDQECSAVIKDEVNVLLENNSYLVNIIKHTNNLDYFKKKLNQQNLQTEISCKSIPENQEKLTLFENRKLLTEFKDNKSLKRKINYFHSNPNITLNCSRALSKDNSTLTTQPKIINQLSKFKNSIEKINEKSIEQINSSDDSLIQDINKLEKVSHKINELENIRVFQQPEPENKVKQSSQILSKENPNLDVLFNFNNKIINPDNLENKINVSHKRKSNIFSFLCCGNNNNKKEKRNTKIKEKAIFLED